MTRIEKLQADYDTIAKQCTGLAEGVPVNEKQAITHNTKLNLSPSGNKLKEALAEKKKVASELNAARADLSARASAMIEAANGIIGECVNVIAGKSGDLPAWPKEVHPAISAFIGKTTAKAAGPVVE